jgi:hypothetical protein
MVGIKKQQRGNKQEKMIQLKQNAVQMNSL